MNYFVVVYRSVLTNLRLLLHNFELLIFSINRKVVDTWRRVYRIQTSFCLSPFVLAIALPYSVWSNA